ncbi:MAG: hypothetical protein COA58_05335 [Bacteroidetes bacterium]|nr:MAG: hypothetical protein COA58_05335 [Bacteroidota bacterium]
MNIKLTILSVLVSANLFVSADDSTRRIGGDFVNFGISVGVGGNRPYYYLPQGRLKLGPIYFELLYEDVVSHTSSVGFTLGMDFLEVNKKNKSSQTVITGSWGTSDFVHPNNSKALIYTYSVLAGITHRPINKRLAYNFKVGGFQLNTSENTGFYQGQPGWYQYPLYNFSSRILPYGEISVVFNVAKNNGQSLTLQRLLAIDQKFPKVHLRRFSEPFKKYFNPYLSLGVGRDRLSLYPNFGLKMGSVFLEAGFANAFDGDMDWHLGAGYYLPNLNIVGVTLKPSIMIERKEKYDLFSNYVQLGEPPYYYYVYKKKGYAETAAFYGLSWRKKDSPVSIRLNSGLGLYTEFRSQRDERNDEWSENKKTKLRPAFGISLVMNMFEYK